jgi:restriction endonuclease Mrr
MIDITTLAINLVKRRLADMFPRQTLDLNIEGLPEDLTGARTLFETHPFDFEYWCCDLVHARPAGGKTKANMEGADRGIDGVITFPDQTPGTTKTEYRKILVQVKGGHVGSPQMRDFRGTIEREKAAGGLFITLQDTGKPMEKEAVEAGQYEHHLTGQKYQRIQIITVEDLLDGKLPDLPAIMSYAKQAKREDEGEQTAFL